MTKRNLGQIRFQIRHGVFYDTSKLFSLPREDEGWYSVDVFSGGFAIRALLIFFLSIVEGNEAELVGGQACGLPVIYEARNPSFAVAAPGAEKDVDLSVLELCCPGGRGCWQ